MASTNLSLSYKQDIWDAKCTVEEISASGNYRKVSLKLEVRTKDFAGGRDGGYHVDCVEGGDISESSCVVPGNSQNRFVLYNKTFDVYVSPGQTYADISLDFEIHFWSESANATRSLSGSISRITGLSIIAGVTISSAKDIYFGDNVNITWTPPTKTFAYKLKFVLGTYEFTTGVLTPNTTSAYTFSGLQIPVNAATNIPNSKSGTMAVTITQYKDSSAKETVGSSVTKNFTVTLKDDVIPTISSAIAALDNSANATVKSWNIGLAGYSKINISASAEGKYGSTIESFTIRSSESTKSDITKTGTSLNYTSDIITSSGNKVYIVTCTDSRGMTSTEFETNLISILPYTKPKMLSLSTVKDDRGTASAEDDTMVVTATWQFDPIGERNSARGAVYYKESSAASWTEHTGVVEHNKPFKLSSLKLDSEKAYNIQVVVTDAVGESDDKTAFTSTTQVLLDFRAGGRGLGVGGICQRDGMEVQMDTTFYNGVNLLRDAETISIEDYIIELATTAINNSRLSMIGAIYPIGSIYMSLNDGNPETILGVGVWEQLEGRFLLGAGTYLESGVTYSYNAGATGGECMHTLTEDEMPSHKHWGVMRPSYDPKAGTHPSPVTDGKNVNYPETNVTGGDLPHNNMPPYLAVYMWKRVA